MKKQIKISDELLEKIISAAYNDINIFDKIRIEILALRNEDVRKIYNEYKETAKSVHSIKEEKLPEKLLDNVYQKINLNKEKNELSVNFYSLFFSKPVISSAVMGIIVILIASVVFINNQKPEVQYSKAEIELAEKQVRESFAIVGKVFKKTQNILEEDILHDKVSKPFNKSINVLNKLFIGGS